MLKVGRDSGSWCLQTPASWPHMETWSDRRGPFLCVESSDNAITHDKFCTSDRRNVGQTEICSMWPWCKAGPGQKEPFEPDQTGRWSTA